MLPALIGAASAQQPAPVAPSTPAADLRPGTSDSANERAGSPCVSERERILLERIERLERRLNEVETRLNATAVDGGRAAAPTAQPLQLTNVAPRQNPAQPTATTASQRQPTQTAQAQTTRANRTASAFGRGGVVEEEQEAHLEKVTVKLTGADAPSVTVTRLDNSTATLTEMITTIPRVKRISAQFDVDDSEDGLEIEDKDGVLAVLRLESEVDGAS